MLTSHRSTLCFNWKKKNKNPMVKLSTINLKSLYVIYITEAIILEVEVNTKMALGLGYFQTKLTQHLGDSFDIYSGPFPSRTTTQKSTWGQQKTTSASLSAGHFSPCSVNHRFPWDGSSLSDFSWYCSVLLRKRHFLLESSIFNSSEMCKMWSRSPRTLHFPTDYNAPSQVDWKV